MADQNQLTGKFIAAGKTEEKGATRFLIRKFWIDITTNPTYPNTPELQLTGDKVALVDNLVKGQEIIVKFNLDGRRYKNPTTGKESIINSLTVWRIEVVNRQSAAVSTPAAPARPAASPAPQPQATAPMGMATQPFGTTLADDDLPF